MRRSEHGCAGGDPAGGGSPAGNRAWEDWIERGVGLAWFFSQEGSELTEVGGCFYYVIWVFSQKGSELTEVG